MPRADLRFVGRGGGRDQNSVCQGCGSANRVVRRCRTRKRVHQEVATPALVLRTRPYGESDRIVTLLTEQHGKVTGIAKGAKNSRRRFAGTLEPFVRIVAVFQHRSTSDLVFLLRCELLGVWRAFTRDLD